MAQAVGKRVHGALRFGWSAGAPLRVRDLALSGVDYGLSGVLSVANLDNIAALTILPDVTLEARDLSRFAGLVGLDLAGGAELAIRGQVAPLTGELSLNFDGTTRDVAVGVARLDPLLAGEGALRLHVERDTDSLRVDPLTINTKQARIEATAKLSRAGSTLSARASVPDVSQALPGMSGAATLSAQVDQKVDGWHVTLSSDLPGKTQAGFQGVITGDGVKQLRAEGTLSADVGQLSVFSDLAGRRLGGAVSLSAQGKADLLARSFDVTATGETRGLDFGVPTLTPLLRGTVGFEASIGRDAQGVVAIRELTASGPAANAALSGSFGPGEGRLEYRLGVGNLGVVIPDLPGPARVSGTAVMRGGPWQIDATGTGPGGLPLTPADRWRRMGQR
ncbi:hypothetical protein U5922_017090 [Aquicoccus sp. G2-2]|uniref:hypothetical protein n=1 Tax=Aquicoccus sp. G2-2 TaxID=3092120 RepID=UPI002ADFDB19|nr:hypothetical protein [Aquicoccus sp. G2-2]MEA1115100.1 hypothetical protein [Aquicoccus sp. G2-2]